MSDSESWIFVEPHPKSKVLTAPIRNVEPRIRSLFQVSDSLPSASSKSPPQQAFQSVSDLECSTAAPTFHHPEPRPAPVSLHDLGCLPMWHDPTPDSAGSWSRPRSLCSPPQDLALSPLTTAPEVPPRDCEVFEKSLHMTHPRSSHAIAAPSKFAKVSSSAHKRVRQPSSNPYLAKKWHFVLEQLGNASQLFEACSNSKFGYQHADRVLDNIAPSTALQYLTAICNFLEDLPGHALQYRWIDRWRNGGFAFSDFTISQFGLIRNQPCIVHQSIAVASPVSDSGQSSMCVFPHS